MTGEAKVSQREQRRLWESETGGLSFILLISRGLTNTCERKKAELSLIYFVVHMLSLLLPFTLVCLCSGIYLSVSSSILPTSFLSPCLCLISSSTVSFWTACHFKKFVYTGMCVFISFLFFKLLWFAFYLLFESFLYARSKEEGGKHTSHPGESLNNPLQPRQGSTGEEVQAARVSTTLEHNSLPKGVQQHNRATAGE